MRSCMNCRPSWPLGPAPALSADTSSTAELERRPNEAPLGADTGISKSEVSRICADLDAEVAAFRDRSLAETPFPYVFLDATYCKARVDRRVVCQAVVIATGVAADGHREVLGFAGRLRRRR